jgi:hypothetical protein
MQLHNRDFRQILWPRHLIEPSIDKLIKYLFTIVRCTYLWIPWPSPCFCQKYGESKENTFFFETFNLLTQSFRFFNVFWILFVMFRSSCDDMIGWLMSFSCTLLKSSTMIKSVQTLSIPRRLSSIWVQVLNPCFLQKFLGSTKYRILPQSAITDSRLCRHSTSS